MKNVLKIVGVFCLAFVAFACSKNDDPADNDLFVGTYKGKIGFTSEGENKGTDNGSITVAKFDENYNFVFSDGIEDLTGVKFKKEGDNTLVNVDFQDGIQYIKITKNSLNMLYMKDGKTWTANAKR
ncbi:hypothetical protein [Capnocytophaga canimorsus]|uniref:hypothetical protein n=1 Tax=Capnocytophaga canimorsus TaxID=28188 RepID=UPI000D6DFEA9|nr:hypothetical protein [Capnocytophaga canimorsus]AWL78977.1 hypothetical protein DKB58_08540 [Capnocytophaga canimorsus]AYW37576.1 hypothetical protein D8L92_09985 [Capnocytophaga canimorsus]MDT9498975.1 hypothetical protein [Capnocytophaga canimorsus]